MRQISVILTLCCLLYFGCRQSDKKTESPVVPLPDTIKLAMHDTLPMPLDSTQQLDLPWADSLLVNYIEVSKKAFVKTDKQKNTAVSFIYDGVEKRDTATYLVYKLGENFEDHYATEQWIYIDSNTKAIFRYDLPNDSLIKWR
jgi:hypothetical protein